jgi:hypothetical protein
MHRRDLDAQGYFLGIPYDFRKPTLARTLRRLYHPGGPLLSPQVFGWGYTPNLARKGTWLLLGTAAVVLLYIAGRR